MGFLFFTHTFIEIKFLIQIFRFAYNFYKCFKDNSFVQIYY